MRIRLARRRDAPALTAFNRAMALETEAKALLPEVISAGVRGLLARPASGFYVIAERNGEVIGALLITKEWSDWRNGDFWWCRACTSCPRTAAAASIAASTAISSALPRAGPRWW